MDDIWIQKATEVKRKGDKVWDCSNGKYLDSANLSIEEIAELIREDSEWEYMSEMREDSP